MDLLQLWVRGDNHLLVRGPRLSFAETQGLFQQLEVPSPESLLRNTKSPGHTIVTRAFRENIDLYCVLPSAHAHSEAVQQLLAELRARGVEELRATSP